MFHPSTDAKDPGYQAFCILRIAFILVPLIAGIDKFFYLLDNWSEYLAPFALRLLGGHERGFMRLAGGVEIIAAIGVYFKPRIFAYVVSLWLLAIVGNILISGHDLDVALRDVGLMLGALALGKLSQKYAV